MGEIILGIRLFCFLFGVLMTTPDEQESDDALKKRMKEIWDECFS